MPFQIKISLILCGIILPGLGVESPFVMQTVNSKAFFNLLFFQFKEYNPPFIQQSSTIIPPICPWTIVGTQSLKTSENSESNTSQQSTTIPRDCREVVHCPQSNSDVHQATITIVGLVKSLQDKLGEKKYRQREVDRTTD